MGFRFRKSFNMGGFRINISKSGIGYSYGVKGVRFTKTAKGTSRTTLSIPGTGLSYVSESGKKNNTSKRVENSVEKSNSIDVYDSNALYSVEFQDLIDNLNKVKKVSKMSNILIWSLILCVVNPLFIITGVIGIGLNIYIRKVLAVSMEYEFDTESQKQYADLCSLWMNLNNSKKLWHIISEKSARAKTNAGAGRLVKRLEVKAIKKLPNYISSNVVPFGLDLKSKQILFFPDKLIVIAKRITAVSYNEIDLDFGHTNFIEEGFVPKDAKVIGKTWKFVNKNGQRDKRYKNNKQLPRCEYGKIYIQSGKALYVEIMCSNVSIIDVMKTEIMNMNW